MKKGLVAQGRVLVVQSLDSISLISQPCGANASHCRPLQVSQSDAGSSGT